MSEMKIREMVAKVAVLIGPDGTGTLRTTVECALADDPTSTAEDIAEIWRAARRDATAER